DSSVGGGSCNKGTVVGAVGTGISSSFIDNTGLLISGSTIGNGVTNASTGVFSISVINTASSGTAHAQAIGMEIASSAFAGNFVNNGVIDVTAFADPPGTAIATATGMVVLSSSFVGNVINTS